MKSLLRTKTGHSFNFGGDADFSSSASSLYWASALAPCFAPVSNFTADISEYDSNPGDVEQIGQQAYRSSQPVFNFFDFFKDLSSCTSSARQLLVSVCRTSLFNLNCHMLDSRQFQ